MPHVQVQNYFQDIFLINIATFMVYLFIYNALQTFLVLSKMHFGITGVSIFMPISNSLQFSRNE